MPRLRNWPEYRHVSPVSGSTLMTSAPQSPSICAAYGPNSTLVRSSTWMPARGPVGWFIGISMKTLLFLWRLSALVEQRLEIGARGLRLALGGFGGFAEAELAVNESGAMMILHRDAGGLQRVRVGFASVA